MHEYLHILTNPGHLAAELTFMVLIDLMFLPVVRWMIRRHDRKVHGK